MLLSEQDFRGSVPESDHFVSVGLDGQSKCPCQAKVRDLKNALIINEQVLWFQVSMHNSIAMAVLNGVQDLVCVHLDLCLSES